MSETSTFVDITIVVDRLHKEWLQAAPGTELRGEPFRQKIMAAIHSEDATLVGKVVKQIVRKRAEFIAESLGLRLTSEFARLGTGGFGAVFAATEGAWSWRPQAVAIKLLNPLLVDGNRRATSSPDNSDRPGGAPPADRIEQGDGFSPRTKGATPQDRFRHEYDILGRLAHRGLPTIFSGGEIKGQPFYVMQHGGPSLWEPRGLGAVLRGGMPAVAVFAADLLEVLAHVHEKKVTHRDLKPSNILVHRDPAGRLLPLLIDFGIAQDRGSEAGIDTKTGLEPGGGDQWSEYPVPADYRTDGRPGDIYNFGRVLEYLLDPEKVRPPDSSPAKASPPDATGDRLRAGLAEVARKCCLPREQGRYTSAAEILADVRTLIGPAHDAPAEAAAGSAGWRFAGNPLMLATAICLLVVAAGAGYFAAPDRSVDLAVAHARLQMAEAERARELESPQVVAIKYWQAEEGLTQARARWPNNPDLSELLARNCQALAQEYERQGLIQPAEEKYTQAIDLWTSLLQQDGANDDYRRGLALAYGCRGDVQLQDDGSGLANERQASEDYDESLAIRAELARRSPRHGDYRLQHLIAQTNFARLHFYSQPGEAREKWEEILAALRQMRASADWDVPTRRAARDLLLDSLLDHLNGYLACFRREDFKEDAELERIVDDALDLTATLIDELRTEAAPELVWSEIRLSYFQSRLGKSEALSPQILDRLETHLNSLPKAKRNPARSLLLELVLSLRGTDFAQLPFWEAKGDAVAKQLPATQYFYAKQLGRWNARPAMPADHP